MFNIRFYKNTSDNKFVTKTLVHLGTIYNVVMLDDYDVLNPVLIVEQLTSNIQNTSGQLYATFTEDVKDAKIDYFSIQISTRPIKYYYLSRPAEIIDNKFIRLTLHEDVLMTYSSYIKGSYAIVRRNENLYNLYIEDTKIGTYANPLVRRKEFPNGFNTSTPTYYITTAGKSPSLASANENHILNITLISDPSAKNGGEFVWIPFASVSDYGIRNSGAPIDFKTNPVGNWVICNKPALYYDPDWQSTDPAYQSNQYSIAVITAFNKVDNTIVLDEVSSYEAGNLSININLSGHAMTKYMYCWSVGGLYDQALQGTGCELWLNSTRANINNNLYSWDNPKQMTLTQSSGSTDYLRFRTFW